MPTKREPDPDLIRSFVAEASLLLDRMETELRRPCGIADRPDAHRLVHPSLYAIERVAGYLELELMQAGAARLRATVDPVPMGADAVGDAGGIALISAISGLRTAIQALRPADEAGHRRIRHSSDDARSG